MESKTTKFDSMILSFACDFTLARDCGRSLQALDLKIHKKDNRLLADIELLEELDYLLRCGKAEIVLRE